MMVVIIQLLQALNMFSESRWTLELDGDDIHFKEWNKDTQSCIDSVLIRFSSSNSWEAKAKVLIKEAIVREATPPEDKDGMD